MCIITCINLMKRWKYSVPLLEDIHSRLCHKCLFLELNSALEYLFNQVISDIISWCKTGKFCASIVTETVQVEARL